MMRYVLPALMVSSVFCQSFEVASVKPSPPIDTSKGISASRQGGPGTNDPTRAVFRNYLLQNLVTVAFGIDFNRLVVPDREMSQHFDVEVRMPEGTTQEQYRLMLQNLLRERFHLTYHFDNKETTAYDLVVAKGGPKFRESTPVPETDQSDATRTPAQRTPNRVDQDGYPSLPPGRGPAAIMANGRFRTRDPEETMEKLAAMLAGQVRGPVTDATGLKGKYEINLQWAASGLRSDAGGDDPGPSIFEAVQEQLGLRLQPKKGTIDVLVVDHIDKTPTEN